MFTRSSRYAGATRFQPSTTGVEVFPGIRAREISTPAGVVEYRIRSGDRLDLLARNFYNDDRLWWRILDANPQLLFGGVLLPASISGRSDTADVSHAIELEAGNDDKGKIEPGTYTYRVTVYGKSGNERTAVADADIDVPPEMPSVSVKYIPTALPGIDDPAGRRIYRGKDGGKLYLAHELIGLHTVQIKDRTSQEDIERNNPPYFDAGLDQPQLEELVGQVILIPSARD